MLYVYAFKPPYSCAGYHSFSNEIKLMFCIVFIVGILLVKKLTIEINFCLLEIVPNTAFSTYWSDINFMPLFMVILSDVIIK